MACPPFALAMNMVASLKAAFAWVKTIDFASRDQMGLKLLRSFGGRGRTRDIFHRAGDVSDLLGGRVNRGDLVSARDARLDRESQLLAIRRPDRTLLRYLRSVGEVQDLAARRGDQKDVPLLIAIVV